MWKLAAATVLSAAMSVAQTCELRNPGWLSCPNHDYPVVTESDSFSTVPLAGDITAIPEFHDCQRLLLAERPGFNPTAYGPLVGIWVSERLDSLLQKLAEANRAKVETPQRLPDSRTGGAEGGSGLPEPSPMTVGNGLAFAEVYAWDGPYDSLGIGKGWNCLYLYPAPDTLRLGAKMLKADSAAECLEVKSVARLTGPKVTDLYVHRDTMPGLAGDDYPPVARWEWDRKRGQQYIGIKCGAAWCEVTRQREYTSSPNYARADVPAKDQRVRAVKGWYDEQTLGVRPTGWLAKLLPGFFPIRLARFSGTIVPDSSLDGKPIEWFGEWRKAGFVVMGGDHDKYGEKNFRLGKMPSGTGPEEVSTVFLCHGSGCGKIPVPCTWDSKYDQDWWARIEYKGTVRYSCINRVNHESEHRKIPGTARWFWDALDEKEWFGCAAGCCTVQ